VEANILTWYEDDPLDVEMPTKTFSSDCVGAGAAASDEPDAADSAGAFAPQEAVVMTIIEHSRTVKIFLIISSYLLFSFTYQM